MESLNVGHNSISFQAQGSWASDCLPSWTLFTEYSLLANFSGDPSAAFDDTNRPDTGTSADYPLRGGSSLTMVQLHTELQTLLTAKASLSCWIAWLDKVVHRGLSGRVSGPKRANAARHLMLVWNYYR